MPRTSDPKRNAEIARLKDSGVSPGAIAAQFGLSYSQVFRAAELGRRNGATVERLAVTQEGQTIPVLGKSGGALFSELGLSGLRRFSGRVDDEYDRVFKSLNKRIQLYREMGDDPIVAAVLQAIKMIIRRVSWYAEPGGESAADGEATEFVNTCMDDMSQSWSDTIDQALGCIQYGFYPAELVYKKRQGEREEGGSKYDDGRIGWRKWVFMAPESLAPGNEWIFDDYGGVQGLTQQAPPLYRNVTLPIEKVILFRTTVEKGNPEGRALLRAMYIPWYYKKNLEEIEAISAERMGTGFPVIYLGSGTGRAGTTGDDLDTAKNMVVNVRVDEQMGLVFPYPKLGLGREGEGVLFELISPPSRGAVDFDKTIIRHEQRMAMVGLAQFIHLGMNQVGARALGDTQTDFFTMAVAGWVTMFTDTIQRYAIDRLMRFNHFPGLTANPVLKHENVEQTNILDVVEYVNKAVGAQVLTPTPQLEEYLLDLADLPKPDNLEELYQQKEQARAEARQAALAQAQAAKQQSEKPEETISPKPPEVIEGQTPDETSVSSNTEQAMSRQTALERFNAALKKFDEAISRA